MKATPGGFFPERYTPGMDLKVRATASRFTRERSGMTREDREDIEQEGRLACWQWLLDNPGVGLGPGLVYLLTMQAARDYERQTRKHREMDNLPDWYDSPLDPAQEEDAILADLLGKIVNDESEAAIAVLVVYEGLSQHETADHLGVDRCVVQRTIQRLQDRAEALGLVAQ